MVATFAAVFAAADPAGCSAHEYEQGVGWATSHQGMRFSEAGKLATLPSRPAQQ